MPPHTIAVVVIQHRDIHPWDLYELGIVNAVFGIPAPELMDPWYELRWCALVDGSGPGDTSQGFGLSTKHGLEGLVDADTVIVPSVPEAWLASDVDPSPSLSAALRDARDRGARIVSLCTGVFALAKAGLLGGRRATAHWLHTDELADSFPDLTVDPSVLYVDDGQVLTSAGLSAGLDLCLHLVRTDLGATAANHLARRLVVPAHRAGGQAQFVERSVPLSDDSSIEPVLHWAREHLDQPLTVADLARRANLSRRTLFRRVQEATSRTPMQWLLGQRIAFAQMLLESSDLSVEQVAEKCGLGSGANLRRHFHEQVGVSPTDYRRMFPCPDESGERSPGLANAI